MAEDLPAALRQLVAELERNGFTIVSDQRDEAHFGTQLLELANPGRERAKRVRLIEERGLWSVEVEIAGAWRDPYQVLRAIDGLHYATRASNHEERMRFTLDAVERMPPVSEAQSLAERLEAFDREYWRRLGVEDKSAG